MSKREAIIQLNCAKRTNSEIIKHLKVTKSTVYLFKKDLRSFVNLKTTTARSKKLIIAVQKRVRKNPK